MTAKLTVVCIFIYSLCHSQELIVSGVVNDKFGNPISNVAVFSKEFNSGAYTLEDGSFSFEIGSRKTTLEVSSIGFKTETVDLIEVENISNITVVLQPDLLDLNEVIVTARKNFNKESSSTYKVESQAIKQIQALNLGDVLNLLPGNQITPPDLNEPIQANLRSGITTRSTNVNAFGTAIIIDGMALSNDANLQAINPSASLNGGDTKPGGGIDLRTISLANVESVEVLTGVASPKYGNLSSGGILVKSKVGASPWVVSGNVTSTNYQASVAKGFDLNKLGVLNTDLSYAYSSGSPTERKVYYQNYNLGLRWKLPVFENLDWNHFTSFRIVHSDDGNRHEPDEFYETEADVKSTSYQLGLSGDFKSFLGKVDYNVSGNIIKQYSFFDTYEERGPFPIVESLVSDTYITTFSPTLFSIITEIKGQPINLNARIEASQYAIKKNYSFVFETGLQYSFDDNIGSGRTATGNFSSPDIGATIGSRSATFEDVRASKIFSVYHQTRIKHSRENAEQRLNLGVRYDNMFGRFNLLSPRVSFSSKHKTLNFRVAWGLSYKAPALIQLYPGRTFLDYTNLNYFAENPSERLAVVTTFVYQPTNENLKPNFVDLREFGFDWSHPLFDLQATYFRKSLQRGIETSSELLLLPKQEYEVVSAPVNQPPVVAPIPGAITNIPREVNVFKNSFEETTNGVELLLNPSKIEATNTEFNFRYSYQRSIRTPGGFDIASSNFVIGDNTARFGVYNNNQLEGIRSFGTLTLIQHIPALRFILTLSAELNFKDYLIQIEANRAPFAYYDIDGNFIPIPESERESSEFADLLKDPVDLSAIETPFYANFNLQVRKETKQGHSFSFFANNAPWYNPTTEINGNRRRLNNELSVGFNLTLLFK